jgi:nanoRNase/pAp phosphatase (c-di-AMP/oligoRNAs hydrolase)
MLLILTHENADFDAVAAQFAAHKLYPEGLPLLSRRVNRNVNQFLTLYWDVLPFMRPADWQRRRIERVLLVDTQSLPSVRGLHPKRRPSKSLTTTNRATCPLNGAASWKRWGRRPPFWRKCCRKPG